MQDPSVLCDRCGCRRTVRNDSVEHTADEMAKQEVQLTGQETANEIP